MSTHLLRITTATAVLVLGALLPTLPGRYDSLAGPVSLVSQVFGRFGLVLVPIGALWLVSGHWSRLAGKQYAFAITALIVCSVVWLALSLGAIVAGGVSQGLGFLALGIYVVSRLLPRLRPLKSAPPRPVSAAALYLVIVPVAVALLQLMLGGPASDFSRDRAIRNSTALIADIERYHAANGRYPASLLSVHEDYSPGVVGIRAYQYEPSGDAYNLVFENPTFRFGTQEFVVYNPRDQQVMTSHKLDRLQLTPAELALDQTRGHNAVHDARQPHWKYFWFD